jgi:hypothetical protein
VIEWNGFELEEGLSLPPELVSLCGNFPDPTYLDFGNPDNTADYFVTDQKEG